MGDKKTVYSYVLISSKIWKIEILELCAHFCRFRRCAHLFTSIMQQNYMESGVKNTDKITRKGKQVYCRNKMPADCLAK